MNFTDYEQLIARKQTRAEEVGFEVDPARLSPQLMPFQRHCVAWTLRKGRAALFEDCGLGKTFQQLSWAHEVAGETGRPVIILCPLAVAGQTIQEGQKFGLPVTRWLPEMQTLPDVPPGVYITNYEQLDSVPADDFAGVVLDESSILKNYEGKTRTALIEAFSATPYRLCCTATPSPNDPMELGNHAEFLGVMTRAEMLAMYFVHDGGDTSQWRIKGHCQEIFWQWVASWAIMLSKPSDIGFEATGYDLPPLNLVEKQIATPKRENGQLFNDLAVSATNFNQELRLTIAPRLETVAELVNASDEPFIVWIKQNEEAAEVLRLIPDAVEVSGSMTPEVKEARLLGFARGEFRVLVTKAKIAQFGLNYQHCRNQVFASLDFSFEGLYQAIRRSYRFGQTQEVNIYLVTTDTMQNVVASIRQKQTQFEQMQEAMRRAMNAPEADTTAAALLVREVKTPDYHIQQGDCVRLIRDVPDESVGLSVFSPPFAELYTYSDLPEDMGNSRDYEEFLTAFRFLVAELYRVMWQGRNVVVHCMDLPIQKGKEGYIGLRDFSGLIRQAFEAVGFIYHSRVTIWKDPVVEMQRTKALGLLHKQVKKDAAMSRVGLPDYLMVFRKPGEHAHPVRCDIPVDLWQKYASPVWHDINYSRTLNYRAGRDERDEKHICPLQLDTIERAIHLWSNPGDTVLTPFMGIGSEVFQAVKMNRKGIGFELKPSYFALAERNCRTAMMDKQQATLFDCIEAEQAA